MKQKLILILFLLATIGGLAGCGCTYPGSRTPEGISATYNPWNDPLMIQKQMSQVTRSLTP